jgi:hypothetical protein
MFFVLPIVSLVVVGCAAEALNAEDKEVAVAPADSVHPDFPTYVCLPQDPAVTCAPTPAWILDGYTIRVITEKACGTKTNNCHMAIDCGGCTVGTCRSGYCQP